MSIYMVILYIGRDRGQGTRNDEKVIKIDSRLLGYMNYGQERFGDKALKRKLW